MCVCVGQMLLTSLLYTIASVKVKCLFLGGAEKVLMAFECSHNKSI